MNLKNIENDFDNGNTINNKINTDNIASTSL